MPVNRILLFFLLPLMVGAQGERPVLEFSHKPGLYLTSTEIQLTGDFDKIYYTTDGEEPYHQHRYREPILIEEPTVLRVRAVNHDKGVDTIVTHFYGVGIKTKLPILSICIAEGDLFSEDSGIYVKGKDAYYSDSAGKYVNTNYNKSWEKPAHAEYIVDGEVAFNQNCGLKLFGETTRRYLDKSMRIIARKEYGKKRFEYPVFSSKLHIDEYKHLVIRTSGNDYKETRFKDALNSTFAAELGVAHQAYQPIKLFVNGEYWGVYNLREKFNEHFFDENYGIDDDSDSVEMFMGRWVREEGKSARRYMEMYRWFEDLDTMDDAAFEKAKEFLDIESFLNWRIIQQFINNPDARGNVRYWRVTHPDSTFKLIFYDSDHSWTYWYRNLLEKLLSPEQTDWYNPEWSTMYFRRLMEHPEFRRRYIVKASHLLNTMFHPDSLIERMDRFTMLYRDELPRDEDEVARHLRKKVQTQEEWMGHIGEMKEFARNRSARVRSNIEEVLGLSGTFILSIEGNQGRVRINGSRPVNLPYSGIYFRGIPMTVKAVSDSTLNFVSWSAQELSPQIEVESTGEHISLHPKFEIQQQEERESHKLERRMIMEENTETVPEHEYAVVFTIFFFALFLAILVFGAWKDRIKQR